MFTDRRWCFVSFSRLAVAYHPFANVMEFDRLHGTDRRRVRRLLTHSRDKFCWRNKYEMENWIKIPHFLIICLMKETLAAHCTYSIYEGHCEIIDTPLAFWTLGEIKTSVHSKVKREDWTGRKREKVGQLWPSTERGAVQGWAMVDSCCQLYPFDQSINDCIMRWSNSPIKKGYRIGFYR